jgi:hypothetical protein
MWGMIGRCSDLLVRRCQTSCVVVDCDGHCVVHLVGMTLTDLLLEPYLPRCRSEDSARGGIVDALCTRETQLNAPSLADCSLTEACSRPKCWLIEAQCGECNAQQIQNLQVDAQNLARSSNEVGECCKPDSV